MANPIVIDISHHQPDPIDWAKVKAGGTVGVFHKATEGTGYTDPCLFARAVDAITEGLCWSTYHFMRPADDITDQIAFYLKTIQPVRGERVCLDHEDAGVSLNDLKDAIQFIIDTRPDLQITLYSGFLIEEQLGGQRDEFLAEHVSLWTAEYDERPTDVEWNNATWPTPALWQYTDDASVDGINGPVDGDKWNGTEENLVKWFGPAELEPEPEPETEETTIAMDLVVEGPWKLAVSINGELVWSGKS